MFIFQSTGSSTPIIITVLSIVGTILVAILVRVASQMYRNADKVLLVTMWKMVLLDKNEYKFRLKVENTTGKVTHMRDISIVYFDGKTMKVYSRLAAMPIQSDNNANFVSGSEEEGYMLRIFPHGKHNVVLDFKVNPLTKVDAGTQFYLYYVNNRGKRRVAKINLGTDRVQVLQFKNHR